MTALRSMSDWLSTAATAYPARQPWVHARPAGSGSLGNPVRLGPSAAAAAMSSLSIELSVLGSHSAELSALGYHSAGLSALRAISAMGVAAVPRVIADNAWIAIHRRSRPELSMRWAISAGLSHC